MNKQRSISRALAETKHGGERVTNRKKESEMTVFKITLIAAAISMPLAASGQEAFVSQAISNVTVTLPIPQVDLSAAAFVSALEGPSFTPSITLPDTAAYRLPMMPTDQSLASISTTGNGNIATIIQNDMNVALIDQVGNRNLASVSQEGLSNQAMIYQASSANVGIILQSGTGNSATVLQW